MEPEFAVEPPEELMRALQGTLESMQRAYRKIAALTATASAADGRMTVCVNAEGVVIDCRLSDDIGDLTFDEIGEAFTRAAQQASQDVRRRSGDLLAPVQQSVDEKLVGYDDDFFPGLSEFIDSLPKRGTISTAPPGAVDRDSAPDSDEGLATNNGAVESAW